MKIKPLNNKLLLKMETVESVGDLDVSSKKTVKEFAEVIEIGPDVKNIKKGDKLFLKAWGVDEVQHEKKSYFFVAEDSESLCAVVTT